MGAPWHMFFLFFCSGATGLLYEAIWSRYLRLLLGSAATAQVVALGLFMGGMSLGALLVGGWSARIRRPFVAYGLVEIAVGLYVLAFPPVFKVAQRFCYDVLLPLAGGGWEANAVKWAVAATLVLPVCTLLGATFPLMSVGMVRGRADQSGRVLAGLYFANSIGAALGAVATGFLLVPWLGLPGSLAFGGALNLMIGAVAVRERRKTAPLAVQNSRGSDSSPRGGSLWIVWIALAFGTGFGSFVYEVAWIRLLSMLLGSATHSFEVMLSAFVLGLALGGLWVRRRLDRFRRPGVTLAVVQVAMGMAAILTLPLYKFAAVAIGAVFYQDERTVGMWILFNVVRYLVCLLIMLPATFCAGMTLPLLTHWLLRRGEPEGTIGRVYGVNTLGAIAGAVVAGMVLLPGIGLARSIVFASALDMGLGLGLLLWLARRQSGLRTLRRSAAVGAVSMVLLGWTRIELDPRVLAAGGFRRGTSEGVANAETVSHVDGRSATITVMRDRAHPGYYTLYTNGKPDATIQKEHWPAGRDQLSGPNLAADEPTQMLLGVLPLCLRPQAEKVALIGIGSAVTAHVLLASPLLETLEIIEIEPEMAVAARKLGPHNWRAFEDPRSRRVFDDAKAHFAASQQTYDLIVSEPSNPWVSGVSSLFTTEFYGEIRRYLRPGGVLAQWVQGYEISDELFFSILAAVDQELGDYRVYRVGSRDWLLLATAEGPVDELSATPFDWPDMEEVLSLLGVGEVGQLEVLFAANKRLLAPIVSAAVPNRDLYPLLDSSAEKSRFLRYAAESLLALRMVPLPIGPVLAGVRDVTYPMQGIPDRRKNRHVLREPEKARALLRAYVASGEGGLGRSVRMDRRAAGAPLPVTSEMLVYLDRAQAIGTAELDVAGGIGAADLHAADLHAARYHAWFLATYEVYLYVAPWIDLRPETWWSDVRSIAAGPGVPGPIRRAVGLLDAAVLREGEKLEQLVAIELGREDSLLDPRLVTLAGVLALQLGGRDPSTLRRFARAHMLDLGAGSTSDDWAYRIVRAWALSPL